MSGPSGERCGICYFCTDPGHDGYHGWCRRYPPPYETDEQRKVHIGPAEVPIGNWCGEFKLHPRMAKHFGRYANPNFIETWE